MKLYEIILPWKDNSGKSLRPAHRALEALLLDAYGGLTKSACQGLWRDPSGRVYDDANVSYRFAGVLRRDSLLATLNKLFPDQEAFYLSCIGETEIILARAGAK
jgi:hypothetical protein